MRKCCHTNNRFPKYRNDLRPINTHISLCMNLLSTQVRDQDGEITRLNKKLFNMKLRVFYLERKFGTIATTRIENAYRNSAPEPRHRQ